MKKYQAIFALNLKTLQDEGNKFVEQVQERLKDEYKAEEISVEKLGKKGLARLIDGQTSAIFFRVVFEAEPSKINPFQQSYRLEEFVLRVVVYNYDIPEDKKELELKK